MNILERERQKSLEYEALLEGVKRISASRARTDVRTAQRLTGTVGDGRLTITLLFPSPKHNLNPPSLHLHCQLFWASRAAATTS